MRADMREKITIKQQTGGKNSYGELVDSWSTVSTVWASKEPLLGNEYFSADMINSKVTVKFRCWYFEGVENNMRIYHNNEIYDILSAINYKSLNREWLFYCMKVD
jgi:SPP1 family predicted phage head-tail adaptor